MKYILPAIVAILMAFQCEAQLQLHPPGEDTMSNREVAKWYADKYKSILSLTNTQEKQVMQAILNYRNSRDSMKSVHGFTTEQRFANFQKLDDRLKEIMTDVQYADYLMTAYFIELRPMRKDSVRWK
ncbi:MAG: hypothetical protein IAE95_07500 [Chitinophagaceae bacterium]|nr:hypothetical protein [Chitinophagaceae bacterium]